mmetsp:Transcript_130152/g.278126  ORF Transcript_130152/g.278126 Transcript_130152/m.278126 type:complete len:223 (+) Transcript_130152:390-1058(+)
MQAEGWPRPHEDDFEHLWTCHPYIEIGVLLENLHHSACITPHAIHTCDVVAGFQHFSWDRLCIVVAERTCVHRDHVQGLVVQEVYVEPHQGLWLLPCVDVESEWGALWVLLARPFDHDLEIGGDALASICQAQLAVETSVAEVNALKSSHTEEVVLLQVMLVPHLEVKRSPLRVASEHIFVHPDRLQRALKHFCLELRRVILRTTALDSTDAVRVGNALARQ